MRTFSTPDRELLAPLSVPILVIPLAASWISRFTLAWSLAVLLSNAQRLARFARDGRTQIKQGRTAASRHVLWQLALSLDRHSLDSGAKYTRVTYISARTPRRREASVLHSHWGFLLAGSVWIGCGADSDQPEHIQLESSCDRVHFEHCDDGRTGTRMFCS